MSDRRVEHYLCPKDAGPWLVGFLAGKERAKASAITIRSATGIRVGDPNTVEFLCEICGHAPALSVDVTEIP